MDVFFRVPAYNETLVTSHRLSICTFNVENIRTNHIYINDLLKTSQLLFLQEHWLYAYQKGYIDSQFPEYNNTTKCCDEYNQQPMAYRHRGHGGVLALWHKDIDQYLEVLDCHSERVLAIRLKRVIRDKSIVVICTYMPAGNSKTDINLYQEILDIVHELISKYSCTADIIWLGDLNGSFLRPVPHKRDILLRNFCQETDLISHGDKATPTFHGSRGTTSRIDHILQLAQQHLPIGERKVLSRESLNTSTHDPVLVELILQLSDPSATCDANSSSTHVSVTDKIQWNNVNLDLFHELSGKYIASILADVDNISTDTLLNKVNTLLYKASKDALIKRLKPTNHKLRKYKWHPSLKARVLVSKTAFKSWKIAGKPSEGPVYTHMIQGKRNLRSTQRQLQAQQRNMMQVEIMDDVWYDQRLFYKLIAKHRTSGNSMPQEMEFSGKPVSQSGLVDAWAAYFQQLATPKDKPHYLEDYKEYMTLKFDHLCVSNSQNDTCHPTH